MDSLLVTGAAGFIGFHTTRALLARGYRVVGLDNLNDYYDPALKQARLRLLGEHVGFSFEGEDLADRAAMEAVFERVRPTRVVHLGAQAGVRHSLVDPHTYARSNLVGFVHVLEGCRHGGVEHLVYASSSSVYGSNQQLPFSEEQRADHPLSLYAATKRANELMAHSYAHLYGLRCTGLRFFTVYGPWGRPDMVLFRFAEAILAGRAIDVYDHGATRRDYTFVDDAVGGVLAVLDAAAPPDGEAPPSRLYNVGNQHPVGLGHLIDILEEALGRAAVRNHLPSQPGDAPVTEADVSALVRDTGFRPVTSVEEGVRAFVAWYREYYGT